MARYGPPRCSRYCQLSRSASLGSSANSNIRATLRTMSWFGRPNQIWRSSVMLGQRYALTTGPGGWGSGRCTGVITMLGRCLTLMSRRCRWDCSSRDGLAHSSCDRRRNAVSAGSRRGDDEALVRHLGSVRRRPDHPRRLAADSRSCVQRTGSHALLGRGRRPVRQARRGDDLLLGGIRCLWGCGRSDPLQRRGPGHRERHPRGVGVARSR